MKNDLEIKIKNFIELLEYKKQIILQGAPGTGKTYLAGIMAKKMTERQVPEKTQTTITEIDIKNNLAVGDVIKSCSDTKGQATYKIEEIEESRVTLSGESIKPRNISFNKIIEAFEERKWEAGKIIQGLDPYEAALAKAIYDKTVIDGKELVKDEFIKLVQFHPSYGYEDFVRGIVVRTKNETPEYVTENKILIKFAKEAIKNLADSKKAVELLSKEQAIESAFEQFKQYIAEKLAEGEVVNLGKTTGRVIDVEEGAFRYYLKSTPTIRFNMRFDDLLKVIFHRENLPRPKDLKPLNLIMKGVESYYFHMLQKFNSFIEENNISLEGQSVEPVKLNKYILIIDEINRANLPAVLGELIYALEYRGESVNGIYEVDGNNKLVLPPNLYIIGTMNTADRSVGHIDYAIRRRFAFVDMLPCKLDIEHFDNDLFRKVSALFVSNYDDYLANPEVALQRSEHLSTDFRPEDVWIGHSYFIMTPNANPNIREIRLKYEIIPILEEYMKDGVLNESASPIIENLS